jgi:hypothetical protein
MDVMPSTVLLDTDYRLPPVEPAMTGMGWVRSQVARFSEGRPHEDRRRLVEEVIVAAGFPRISGSVTASLLAASGLSPALEHDVAMIAAAYQPHMPSSPDADAAADRLVAACGGRTKVAAARICVLVQAHAATLALIESMRTGSGAVPVPTTRRIAPRRP